TAEAGFAADNAKFSLAATWVDFDLDGDMDLYVVNDFGRNNLFVNDGKGHFVDRAAELGLQDIGAGMGAAVADYDLDGDLDLYVTNMFSADGLRTARQERYLSGRDPAARLDYVKHARGNSLLRNRGDGSFEDVTEASGTALGRWAWGAKFVDFDGDGWEDLFVPNGQTSSRRAPGDLEGYFWRRVVNASPVDESSLEAYAQAFETIQNLMMFGGHSWNGHERNNAYLNLRDGSFVEASHVSGLGFVDDARSAAIVDWDDDGREDLLVRNRTAPRLRLLLNRTPSTAHFISFQLAGRTCNRDAVGAALTLTVDGRPRTKRVTAGDGYLAQSSLRLTFGLGAAERVERVVVAWPDGSRSTFEDLEVDRHYLLGQGADEPVSRAPSTPPALATAEFPPNERDPAPIGRIPLFDPMPMAALELPAFEGPARRLGDWNDDLVLVLLWSGAHPSGPAALAELGEASAALAAADVRVVCLTTDEGPERARARRTIADTPFAADAGYMDDRTREALMILTLELLGSFDRVPQPYALLVDRQSRACVIYLGPPDPALVLADAAIVAAERLRPQPRARRLAGGPWFTRNLPRREFKNLTEVLAAAGFEPLAEEMRAYAAQRNQGAAGSDGDDNDE
ncbi:MAG TPA: CRTAC1 family protein, partial [Planctomycetota bacterium]|nr:CRTAC1 family protein [Planctomycetota bacterium]